MADAKRDIEVQKEANLKVDKELKEIDGRITLKKRYVIEQTKRKEA